MAMTSINCVLSHWFWFQSSCFQAPQQWLRGTRPPNQRFLMIFILGFLFFNPTDPPNIRKRIRRWTKKRRDVLMCLHRLRFVNNVTLMWKANKLVLHCILFTVMMYVVYSKTISKIQVNYNFSPCDCKIIVCRKWCIQVS